METSPIVKLVNQLFDAAIERSVSDIHLEPTRHQLHVRYRIDGLLHPASVIDSAHSQMAISRIKVLAGMNVAERRIPQDGTFSYLQKIDNTSAEKTVRKDLRIATFPTVWGEKVVIRILSGTERPLLDQLGIEGDMKEQLLSLAQQSRGFFLVTGPTGSGKTTTLHALLSHIESTHKNIVTLEDPIEYLVDGINQSQILSDIGFSFEHALRSLLRQDPDIIMVGEIRDPETAHAAIQAALTGHVVLSTIHTYDTISTIMRLLDMGIEPFLITASLTGILSQRLARRLCFTCKEPTKPTQAELQLLEKLSGSNSTAFDSLYRPKGCEACYQIGYTGRVGIFQILCLSDELKAMICERPPIQTLTAQAVTDGMNTLVSDGLRKVKQGITSLEEFARVVL